jgi:3-phosphoshikimate 1-carboxyvinyltransferase
LLVRVSGKRLEGVLKAPPSKSYTHRALICASLARGRSRILNPLLADDTFTTLKALTSLGVEFLITDKFIDVFGGVLKPKVSLVNCEESGTTLRFILGVASLVSSRLLITGSGSLLRRPIGELVRALSDLGAKVLSNGDYLPVISYGGLKGGIARVRGDISSQFISSLLIVSVLAKEPTTIIITSRLESKPYVEMTLKTQECFGVRVVSSGDVFEVPQANYKPTEFSVEGDWSSITYFLVGGAISGYVRVLNVDLSSLQPDKKVLDVLRMSGASVVLGSDWVEVSGGGLEGFEYDVSDSPDLLPALSVLAAVSKGTSVIRGVSRCRLKESDRVEAVVTNLKNLGVDARVLGDEVLIKGCKNVKPGVVSSYGDHRIAMAFSLLSLVSDYIVIDNPFCVSKSYPNFWEDLNSLGVKVEVVL